MFFLASKVFWLLAQPVSLALLFGVAGLVLAFTPWRWAARIALLAGIAVLGASAFSTLGYVLLRPLEAAFERPALPPPAVTGIIVLGGGMDAKINAARGGYELNRAGDRFVEALRLAERYPDARIVVSGGIGGLDQSGEPEALAGKRFFLDMGVERGRLLLETRSRNTDENAAFSKALIDPRAGDTWLLVTSAFHMPRSVGLFRKAGFEVVPWPVDYRGTGAEGFGLSLYQPAENLTVTTLALREWAGLAAYNLTGRIDELLPSPK